MMARHRPVLATLLVFLLGFAFCGLRFPHFASMRVATDLLVDNAFIGVMAVGMSFVIISGGIDLSVGAVLGFSTVAVATLIGPLGLPPLPAFALVLLAAALFGALMGGLIHLLEMPAFIVTLAGMFLARGCAFLISTRSIPIASPVFDGLANWSLPLPGGAHLALPAVMMLAAVVAGGVLLHATRFGASVYALGGSRAASRLMGIPLGRITVLIYALSGMLAGLAGIVFALGTSSGYALSGLGSELDTIAAVVIGGTLLSGGSGTLAGTLLGVLIEGLILSYINFDGTLSSWWARIATGALLFGFIALQRGLLGGVRTRHLFARPRPATA